MTRDKVSAITGNARQGSFGSPSINDKGTVAYACVLSGPNVGALTSYSIVSRRKGKNPAILAIQSGVQKGFNSPNFLPSLFTSDPRTLNDDFLIDANGSSNVYPVPWTGRMYRISKDVAINNRNNIAFAGQLIETIETVTRGEDNEITNITYSTQSYATIGLAIPAGSRSFSNTNITTYLNYFDGILTRTTSLNQANAVPYDGNFRITTDEFLPGFAYNSPTVGGALVATIASNVIGLPYFTTFVSFSDPIIAANNVCFIVANISETGAQFDGIWQGNNPNLQPVVTIQTDAPGGGRFTAFDEKPGPSPNGKYVAFIGTTNGTNASRGVYRTTTNGQNIIPIATVGGNALGNKTFREITQACSNNRGQVAFLGTAARTGGNGNVLDGIWVSDRTGKKLRQVVLKGQSIMVGKKMRKISNLAFSPFSGMNKKGQVAFTASFTDRTSAVIVANVPN